MSLAAQKFIDALGFDVADIFEPWESGDPHAADTGFQNAAGDDLSAVLAPLSVGSAIDHDTMFQNGAGTDLNAIFAKKGSRSGSAISATIPSTANAVTHAPGGTASADLTCVPAGGSGTGYTFLWTVVSGSATITNATSPTCTVQEAVPGTGSITSTFKCHVVDSASNSCDSNNGVVTFKYVAVGGSDCLRLDQWLAPTVQVRDAHKGMLLDARTDADEFCRLPIVNDPTIILQLCYRLIAANGYAIECTVSTPFTLPDGESYPAPRMLGRMLLCHETREWSPIVTVQSLGRCAAMLISLGGASYAGGDEPNKRSYSHNTRKFGPISP
ncbi:MAG: hypothetical protein ACRES7_00210 [Gammaproteobacteria bacterium]